MAGRPRWIFDDPWRPSTRLVALHAGMRIRSWCRRPPPASAARPAPSARPSAGTEPSPIGCPGWDPAGPSNAAPRSPRKAGRVFRLPPGSRAPRTPSQDAGFPPAPWRRAWRWCRVPPAEMDSRPSLEATCRLRAPGSRHRLLQPHRSGRVRSPILSADLRSRGLSWDLASACPRRRFPDGRQRLVRPQWQARHRQEPP
jgi:hypothetical protein